MNFRSITSKSLLLLLAAVLAYATDLPLSSIFSFEKNKTSKSSEIESATSISGRVIGVKDGDTIEILVDGEPVVVRLADVDSPEKNQPFGQKAKGFTSDFCFNQTVTVRKNKKRDRYKRIIGTVHLDGKNLNEELLKAGLAWHYKRYSNSPQYAVLEQEARNSKIGLWSDKNPVYPEDWRKRKRAASSK